MLQELIKDKVLVVIRYLTPEEALNLCQVLLDEGFRFVEVSFSDEWAEETLKKLRSQFGYSVFLGAGTVFDEDTYRKALKCGVDYVLSPGLSRKVAELAIKDGKPYIPGVFTPTDVQDALEMGFELLKLYPADVNLLRSYRGPFPKAKFMPFGGVDDENILSYFKLGAAAVGIGNYIANKELLSRGEISQLRMRVKKLRELLNNYHGFSH